MFPFLTQARAKQSLSPQNDMPGCKINSWLSTIKQPYLSKRRLSVEWHPIPPPSLIRPHSSVWQIAPQVHSSKSELLHIIEANVISYRHFLHARLARKGHLRWPLWELKTLRSIPSRDDRPHTHTQTQSSPGNWKQMFKCQIKMRFPCCCPSNLNENEDLMPHTSRGGKIRWALFWGN